MSEPEVKKALDVLLVYAAPHLHVIGHELNVVATALEELQKDKTRLDFLEASQNGIHWDDDDIWVYWNGKRAATGNTVREALDNAKNLPLKQ